MDIRHKAKDNCSTERPNLATLQEMKSLSSFTCQHCGRLVSVIAEGTKHRNHCPWCLWGKHVDIRTGDRLSSCRGSMEPIAISVQKNGEWSIIHRCVDCGKLSVNRIAGDDGEMALLSLSVQPLARPPFPIESIGGLQHG